MLHEFDRYYTCIIAGFDVYNLLWFTITYNLRRISLMLTEVEGGRKPHIIRYQLSKSLKPHVEYRESMFERVYPINERLADRMIAVGYKQPSRFGRWCPVQVCIEFDCCCSYIALL